MKYLKITAENYNEAMKKLRMDHGDEAIPISHKYVKQGGFFNSRFFSKEVVELTAAVKEKKSSIAGTMKKSTIDFTVDDSRDIAARTAKVLDTMNRAASSRDEVDVDSINRSIDTLNDSLNTLKKPPVSVDQAPAVQQRTIQPEVKTAAAEPVSRYAGNDTDVVKHIEREMNDIKSSLNRLLDTQKQGRGIFGPACDEEGSLNPYREMLRSNDFDTEDCELIIRDVRDSISKEDLKDKFKIEKSLKDLLKSRIVTAGPIKKGNRKKIIMFIGPTGVGKTTTMAKLGAIHSLREGNKVAFITIDNYRIAATEQLKKYAEIMRIPVHVVSDQRSFREVLTKEKSDLVMVDTSGRSHNNDLKIAEIKSFADSIEYDFEKILCVSASTKKGDLKEIFRAFDVMKFDSVIITKVDETSFIGNVIDIADKYNKPISYLTDGQEVPNDIHIAEADRIVDMIIRESAD
ncbi:MAG TPA: flagellar biosynthesis protein FlhF [Spirochaetota bacterium]|nr:flagellar biosynthesis protein FlhF [Spirochaetota bacterium]